MKSKKLQVHQFANRFYAENYFQKLSDWGMSCAVLRAGLDELCEFLLTQDILIL